MARSRSPTSPTGEDRERSAGKRRRTRSDSVASARRGERRDSQSRERKRHRVADDRERSHRHHHRHGHTTHQHRDDRHRHHHSHDDGRGEGRVKPTAATATTTTATGPSTSHSPAVYELLVARSAAELPFGARTLHRGDFDVFRPFFAYYLDLHKQLDIGELSENEVRGRWKSFVKKWNAGELAEGWYDPEMFEQVVDAPDEPLEEAEEQSATRDKAREAQQSGAVAPCQGRNASSDADDGSEDPNRPFSSFGEKGDGTGSGQNGNDDNNDDDWGPTLPSGPSDTGGTGGDGPRHGPGIPSLEDLALRREMDAEDREAQIEDLRRARRADRTEQKERLDDLLGPRAEAGTHERRLEKKREVGERLRAGARATSPGAAELGENELMGGGDGAEDFRRARAAEQRRKTEREIRREEILRARAARREERMQAYQAREEETMVKLRELAKQRFG